MGSSSSRSSSMDEIANSRELIQETGFSYSQLLSLYERFDFLDADKAGHLRHRDFAALKELEMNPIGDRIIGAFFTPGQETVDFPAFVRVLAHFRPVKKIRMGGKNQSEPMYSRTGKLRFAFQLYDQDRDGKISRAELLEVLRAMLGMQVNEEQLQSIAERAIQEADLDKDNAISFDEFRKSLEKVDIDHMMSISYLS